MCHDIMCLWSIMLYPVYHSELIMQDSFQILSFCLKAALIDPKPKQNQPSYVFPQHFTSSSILSLASSCSWLPSLSVTRCEFLEDQLCVFVISSCDHLYTYLDSENIHK